MSYEYEWGCRNMTSWSVGRLWAARSLRRDGGIWKGEELRTLEPSIIMSGTCRTGRAAYV